MHLTPIERTFCHIPGIGIRRERALWESGVLDWNALADAAHSRFPSSAGEITRLCEKSRAAFDGGDWRFFSSLPRGASWRLFSSFDGPTGYLDIETTSVSIEDAFITVIGLYTADTVYCFMSNFEDLDGAPPVTPGEHRIVIAPIHRFEEVFGTLKKVVTFNGTTFDLPIIRNWFPLLDYDSVIHLDLKFALRSLGIRGGLKKLEKIFGIERPEKLDGLNGRDAVNLWLRFRQRADQKALATLLDYNIQDILNLEPLTRWVIARNLAAFPSETRSVF